MADDTIQNEPAKNLEKRKYGRKRFNEILPIADCKTEECVFRAVIHNISSGGVFIKTNRNFSIGQEIAMQITFPSTRETVRVTGEITRISSEGAGVDIKILFKE